jgi:putative ABC transport system permease protein
MESLWQDVRYALRASRRSPGYALFALLTIALGVGANTAVFTVVDHVVLRQLPYREPDRLMMVWHVGSQRGELREPLSYPTLTHLQSQSRSAEWAGVSPVWNLLLATRLGPERTPGHFVSVHLFRLLGVSPVLGRAFLPADAEPGAESVALVSHSLWRRHFGGDPEVVGKTVNVGMPYRVVGVLPAGFRLLEEVDVWIPLGTSPAASADRTRRTLRAIGRLAPGAKRGDAEAELGALARQLELEYPEAHTGLGMEILPLHEVIVGPVRPALILLLGAVGFVLLVACANLATLLLSRAVARQKEIAIRTALGAGKGRIARFLLTESLMLPSPGASWVWRWATGR